MDEARRRGRGGLGWAGVAAAVLAGWLVVGLVLLGALASGASPSTTPPIAVHVESCDQDGGAYRMRGHVTNWSDRPVHFVELEARFRDRSGSVVDVTSTYAVGSERLRRGESATFTTSTNHASAYGCAAELLDFRFAE